WRLRISDLAVMASLQRAVLRGAASIVRPGGLLVYSTCSLEPEENDAQVDAFLAEHPDFAPEPPPEGAVPEAALDGGRRRVLPYFVVGGAGFLIAYLVVYLFVFPSRLVPNDRPVPNVVGMLQVDAERALRDAGFQPQQGERRVNASVPPETVVAQTPPATTMKPPNTTVIIDIAASP